MLTDAQLARKADALLKDPVMIDAWEGLRRAYVAAMRQCDVKDDLGRYRYTVALAVIDGVSAHLQTVVARGHISEKQQQAFQSSAREKIARIF